MKNSPLALLAQTCNSIGKDVIPFNRTLSTSTTTTFSILSCNGSKGHDPHKNDDHSREHLRCSSEDDVTSTMTTNKSREFFRKNGDVIARKNSTPSEHPCAEDEQLDVVGMATHRDHHDHQEDEALERNSEPLPLTSKHQSKPSVPKARSSQAMKSTSSASSASNKRSVTGKHDNVSRKSENRNSKDHRAADHGKKSDSWLINLPFKQNGFAPAVDGIYPGYFNFFPPDYSNFLKNYYMSQVNAHQSAPFLNFSYSTFSEQLGKLRASPHSLYSSFSPNHNPLQHPPHSPPTAAPGLKSRGDLFAPTQGKQSSNHQERNIPSNFLPPPVLTSSMFQSSKDLQNLSYLHFLSQHNPMLLSAPLTCPFPFKPIGDSCSKLFSNYDDVMDHVRLHWTEGKDSNPLETSMFSVFPQFAYNPFAWSLKAFDDTPQQVGKFSPGASSRFHPYVKPFLSNHVP